MNNSVEKIKEIRMLIAHCREQIDHGTIYNFALMENFDTWDWKKDATRIIYQDLDKIIFLVEAQLKAKKKKVSSKNVDAYMECQAVWKVKIESIKKCQNLIKPIVSFDHTVSTKDRDNKIVQFRLIGNERELWSELKRIEESITGGWLEELFKEDQKKEEDKSDSSKSELKEKVK